MSKLLHSKTFRENLAKWLILYALALSLVTGVVTYSKYISSVGNEDSARTAKFNVKINQEGVCSTISENLCNLNAYKPYDTLEYRFNVDTSEVEVSAIYVFLVTIKEEYQNDFEIVSFNDIDLKNLNQLETRIPNYNTNFKYEDNRITLIIEAKPIESDIKYFKLRIKLKDIKNFSTTNYTDIVKVNYSVTQTQ